MQSVLSIIAVLGVGSIVAALISWRVAIANHRQAWINGLRDDIATFLKELEVMHRKVGALLEATVKVPQEIEQQQQESRVEILFTYWRIILRLNRTEAMHADLRQRLDDLMVVAGKVPDPVQVADFVDLSRQILKQEWNVTKYGVCTRPILWLKSKWGPK